MSELLKCYVVAIDTKPEILKRSLRTGSLGTRCYLTDPKGGRSSDCQRVSSTVDWSEANELAQKNDGKVLDWMLPRDEISQPVVRAEKSSPARRGSD